MKHSSRRILALLLALSLCIGMMPMSIFADDEPAEPTGDPAATEDVLDPTEGSEGGSDVLEEETKEEPAGEPLSAPAPIEEPAAQPAAVDEGKTDEDQVDQEQKIDVPALEMKKVEEASAAELLKASPAEEAPAAEEKKAEAPVAEEDAFVEKTVLQAVRGSNSISGIYYFGYPLAGKEKNYQTEHIFERGELITWFPSIPADLQCPEGAEIIGWNWYSRRIDPKIDRIEDGNNWTPFYAVWKLPGENVYDVSFYSGFSDCMSPSSIKVVEGKNAAKPSTYYNSIANNYGAKNGFRFRQEWFNLADLNALKEDGTDFDYRTDWALVTNEFAKKHAYDFPNRKIMEDTTFVASWIKTWTVTFIDTSEKIIDSKIVDHEGTVKAPENLKFQEGFKYSWYYLDESGAEVTFDFNTPITSDLELHLKKTAFYTVKYCNVYPPDNRVVDKLVREFSESEYEEMSGKYQLLTLEATEFKAPEGYKFLGWKIVDKDPTSNQNQGGTVVVVDDNTARKKPALMPVAKALLKSRLADSEEKATVKENVTVTNAEKEKDQGQEASAIELLQPGDYVELKAWVYVVPVWGLERAVFYRSEYPAGSGLDNKIYEDKRYHDSDAESFEVLDYKAAGFEQPKGYVFDGWVLRFIDTTEEYNKYLGDEFEQVATLEQIDVSYQEATQDALMDNVAKKAQSATRSNASKADAIGVATEKVIVWPDDKPVEFGEHIIALLDARWKEVPSYRVLYNTNYPNGRENDEWIDKIPMQVDDPFAAYLYVVRTYKYIQDLFKANEKDETFVDIPGWVFIGWSETPGKDQPLIDSDEIEFGPLQEKDPSETVIEDLSATLSDVEPREDGNLPEQEQSQNSNAEVISGDQAAEAQMESKYDKVFYAQWKECPVVYYHMNNPHSRDKENPQVFFNAEPDEDGSFTTFTVKDFAEAFGADMEEPIGYTFRGDWEIRYIPKKAAADAKEKEPAIFPITPQTSMEALKEEVRATEKVAAQAKKVAAEMKDYPTEALNHTVSEAELFERIDTLTKAEFVDAGQENVPLKWDDFIEVHLYAQWTTAYKVIYHNVHPKSEFVKNEQIKEDDFETFTVVYTDSAEEFKAGKFTVLAYDDCKGEKGEGELTMKAIPEGYEFDHWTIEFEGDKWVDPNADAEAVIIDVEEDDEELEENKIEKKEKAEEAVSKKAAKTFKVADQVERINVIADTTETAAEEARPRPNFDDKPNAVKVIVKYPGEEQGLYQVVHVYAWWTPEPFVVYDSNFPDGTHNQCPDYYKSGEAAEYAVKTLKEIQAKTVINDETGETLFDAPAGYKFAGWYLDEDCTEKAFVNNGGEKFDLTKIGSTTTEPENGEPNTSDKETGATDVKPNDGTQTIDPSTIPSFDPSNLPNNINDIQPAPFGPSVAPSNGTSEETKAKAKEMADVMNMEVKEEAAAAFKPEQEKVEEDVAVKPEQGEVAVLDDTVVTQPEVIFYAKWVPCTATWKDEDGTTLYGPVDFKDGEQPKDTEYNTLSGKDNPTKAEDDEYTYDFSGWKEEADDEGNVTYTAQYTATPKNPNNPTTGGTNPKPKDDPKTDDPAEEDTTEVDENETPLAGYEEDPEEDAEEVGNNETPLAGFEVDPEEEDEIAEEATPFSPYTGDDRNTVVWGIVSILSLLGIVLVARKRREE